MLHVKTSSGERFFTEEDVDDVATEITGKTLYELKHEESLDNFKNEYFRVMKSPLEHINDYENDAIKLKEMFEGYPSSILKLKDPNLKPEDIQEMTRTLNDNSTSKIYQQITDKNARNFIIERSVARKVDIGPILHVVENQIKPMIAEVC